MAHEIALLQGAQARVETLRLLRSGEHHLAARSLCDTSMRLSSSAMASDALVTQEIDALHVDAGETAQGLAEERRKDLKDRSYLGRSSQWRDDRDRR